jgi:elongation factor P
MASTSDISRGLILKLDGSLYTVVEFGENKTARSAAKVWAKLKGVDNNRSIEKTWNSGETIYPVRVERKDYQFLYKDDTGYNFMDTENFEQVASESRMHLSLMARGSMLIIRNRIALASSYLIKL